MTRVVLLLSLFRDTTLGVTVVVLGIYGGVGYYLLRGGTEGTEQITVPADSFIGGNDSSYWIDSTSVMIRGTITNTHSKWSIKDISVEVKATDKDGNLLRTSNISVTRTVPAPGGNATYSGVITVPASCEQVQPFMEWQWVPPE